MSDLIRREDALKELRLDHKDVIYIDKKECARRIKAIPSADRPQGKWIDETFKPWGLVHHPYKCDQCGEHSEANSNFCPNCGAKMDGEREGE